MKYNIQTITESELSGAQERYLFFWGHQPSKNGDITKSCLSQWWPSMIKEEGRIYHTAEHYMMAHKALLFNDIESVELIAENTNPKEVKALGRKVKNFDEQKWNQAKYEIVRQGNLLKFSQNPSLASYLISSGSDIIVEASPVDAIWGIGMAENHPDVMYPEKWKGENLLGFALMEVRDELTPA